MFFFTLRRFFLFRSRVFPRALGSVAHREPARTPYASLGPGRGTCSGGSSWDAHSRRHSEHVESSRPMQTCVHNKL